jgi:phosphoribosyl 1,2-cyclic phosphodiesterase
MEHDDPCVGYVFGDRWGNKAAIVTDTGVILCEALDYLMGCNALLVEANYDKQMLLDGPYPLDLQERIFNTHLSNTQAGELIKMIKPDKVVLMHMSKSNNSPAFAQYEAGAELISDQKNGCEMVAIL